MPRPKTSPPPLPQPGPHLGPVDDDDRRECDRFASAELAIVLSHYDLGVISRVREFRRGSRRSPKVRITSERGDFLLKRRAPDREDPRRVAFAHDLQARLETLGYPVPGMVPTRSSAQCMLRLGGRIYEMFHFVEGTRDDRSPDAAGEAGAALGRLHRLLADYRPGVDLEAGSYHAAAGLEAALRKVPAMVAAAEPSQTRNDLERRCAFLHDAYREAARRVDAAGLGAWPRRVVHGDWHPGNLLFRKGAIVAVLDFDSARLEPRLIDLANAALQFGMVMTRPDDPARWPDGLDVDRIRALMKGYDEEAGEPVAPEERGALPWLIVEALVLESVAPIAATGRFGRLGGGAMLEMVERKLRWLELRADRLVRYVA